MQDSLQPGAAEAAAFVEELVAAHPDPAGRLFFVLNAAQRRYRFLPAEVLAVLARIEDVAEEEVQAFATAFHAYSLAPVGRLLVEVCDGAACHAAGAPRLVLKLEELLGVKAGETSADGRFTLRVVRCVGSCSAAPVVVLNGEVHGRVRLSLVGDLLDDAEAALAEVSQVMARGASASLERRDFYEQDDGREVSYAR